MLPTTNEFEKKQDDDNGQIPENVLLAEQNENDNNEDKNDGDDVDEEEKIKESISSSKMSIISPFWSRISSSKRILLSGCGGGFDIYQGIPLYFALKEMGYEVFFANYSFAGVEYEENIEIWYDENDKSKNKEGLIYVVDASKKSKSEIRGKSYFPEYYLSLWFKEKRKLNVPIYTFPHYGYKTLCAAYNVIVDKLNIDTIITIDGGTDSLMKGNEYGVGTVEEDYNSIFAVKNLKNKKVKQKMLICLGMGVDRYHGVSDVSTLRAIAELTVTESYLGCIHLLPYQQPCKYYLEASKFAYKYMQSSISIVGASILTSISGKFGNEHWPNNYRTKGSKLFINPLMSIYWIFDLDGVYKRINKHFKKEYAKCTNSFNEVRTAVRNARTSIRKNGDMLNDHENYPATDDLRE